MESEKKSLDKSEKLLLQPVLTINEISNGFEKFSIQTKKRSTPRQIFLGLIANFTCISPSMSIGFSAILLPYLLDKNNPYRMTDSQGSWIASVASIGTPFGSLLSGPISDKFGRKITFIFIHIICFLGWFIIAAAFYVPDYQFLMLIVGRIFTGMSTGLTSMPPSIYLAEISSPKLRGLFVTWSSIFFSLGVLLVYLLGYINKENWFLTAMISGLIPLIGSILVYFFVLESPTWLVSVGNCNKATKNMCSLFSSEACTPQIQQEINTIILSKQKAQAEIESRYSHIQNPSYSAKLSSSIKYFMGPTCIKPFIIMLAYFFFQQFSGTFVIIFYAVNIIQDAGVSMDAFVAAVIIALTRLVGSVVVGFLSKSYGRRPPSIISGAGITITMVLLGSFVLAKSNNIISPECAARLNWVPLTLLVLYIFLSTLGFYPIPFAMSAEIFPTRVKGMATGILTCAAYTFTFVTVKMYPAVEAAIGAYGLFFLFGGVALVGTIFLIVCLPETKGKTLEEIEEYFGNNKKHESERRLSNNVFTKV